jgi:hypothetical protein
MAITKRKQQEAPRAVTSKPTAADKPLDPAKVYVAWMGWADDRWAVRTGEELRGSDVRVQARPAFFVLADTPLIERPTPYDRLLLEQEQRTAAEAAENTTRAVAVSAEQTPMVRLTRDVIVSRSGKATTVEKGSTAFEHDEIVTSTGRDLWELVK